MFHEGPLGRRGAPKGPAHEGPGEPSRQGPWGAHKGPTHKGAREPTRAQPTRAQEPQRAWPTGAQGRPQGPDPQGPRGARCTHVMYTPHLMIKKNISR